MTDRSALLVVTDTLSPGIYTVSGGGIVTPNPAPDPGPTPDPTPDPVPTPDPDPQPDPGGRPASISRELNSDFMLRFDYWNGGSRYQRYSRHITWKDDQVTVGFASQHLGGGTRRELQGDTYTLLIDGQPTSTYTASPGDVSGSFDVDVTSLSDGWHVLDITPHGTETAVPFPVFVFLDDTLPDQEWMPVYTGSKDHHERFRLHWVSVSGKAKPDPLPKREFPAFDEIPQNRDLYFEAVTGTASDWPRRKFRTSDGIYTTATLQWYTWADVLRKKPRLPLLDGPRNVNALGYATHVDIGRASCEETGPIDNLYVVDPWRVSRVRSDGSVQTLFGYRDKGVPVYWDDERDLELVGDWSAIPQERHGLHEAWGMAWDSDTFEIDTQHPRIIEEGNRHPHQTGPVMFVADSQNNRVLKAEFDPKSHAIEPKITEFVTAPDCWDVVAWGEEIIVSVRGDNRINAYDKAGNLLRTIVQGEPLAIVNRSRGITRTGTLDAIRAQDVVLPEGLYVVDDWLYYGSAAMGQIRRVHLIDGRFETFRTVSDSSGAQHYYKIAVSDGTAGEKGTVFLSSWIARWHGAPRIYAPDGTPRAIQNFTYARPIRGRGSMFSSIGYSGAVAARNGRIVYSSSFEGLRSISMAQPGDELTDLANYRRGRDMWIERGYDLRYGENAQSRFGEPLPIGEHSDMDYFMQSNKAQAEEQSNG